MPSILIRLAMLAVAVAPACAWAGPAAGCDAPLPPLESAAGVPVLLRDSDGTPVATAADWACKREALRATAQAYVYGDRGPEPGEVAAHVADGRLQVLVRQDGREVALDAALRLPPGPAPHPVMILVGPGGGVDQALLDAEGVALLVFDPTTAGAETGQSRERRGAYYALHGGAQDATGTLMAWAWGVSRLVDAIAQVPDLLRADAVGVAGCSRYGKGALAAGAFDARIALTVPIESGSGGVPLWRGVATGGAQPPHSAFGEQPWLGESFAAFAGDVERLPIDQHAVLALVAPRGLLVLDNPLVDWLGAPAGQASVRAALPAYRLLGAAGNLGYYGQVADSRHCAWRAEWDRPARDAIRRHLRGLPAEDLAVAPAGPADLAP
ncbi:glucuronyl esterase domain-containing protein [Luteimonas sp. SDU82]|uniref:glucuronyl esterase domain-containing protein n=1 Tax=Luteimonas sp. SDU82 TaxID=3422592 RepID=UPI003EBB98E3